MLQVEDVRWRYGDKIVLGRTVLRFELMDRLEQQYDDELQRLVDAGAQRFYIGHGGPLPAKEVLRHAQVLRTLARRHHGGCCG